MQPEKSMTWRCWCGVYRALDVVGKHPELVLQAKDYLARNALTGKVLRRIVD